MKRSRKISPTSDPIADLLTRLRNAAWRRQAEVLVPYSVLKEQIVLLLQREGYLADVNRVREGNDSWLQMSLRYHDREPVIRGLKRLSKPGRRLYLPVKRLPRVLSGYGLVVVSTSRGLLTDHEARRRRLGGEVLFAVW